MRHDLSHVATACGGDALKKGTVAVNIIVLAKRAAVRRGNLLLRYSDSIRHCANDLASDYAQKFRLDK